MSTFTVTEEPKHWIVSGRYEGRVWSVKLPSSTPRRQVDAHGEHICKHLDKHGCLPGEGKTEKGDGETRKDRMG